MNCEKCESVKEYCEEEIENDTPYLTKYDNLKILEPKEKEMVCSECGQVDESYSAFCGRCGRSDHHLREKESNVFENEDITMEILKITAMVDDENRVWGMDTDLGSKEKILKIINELLEKAIARSKELGEKK